MLKTSWFDPFSVASAYHLGEGRVLKTYAYRGPRWLAAYHLGEGRVLKTEMHNL